MNRRIEIERHEWDRVSGCDGKVRYGTNEQAAIAKRKINGGRLLKIYNCRFCGGFHLATKGD